MIKEERDKDKRVLFLDIDGILADPAHRLHYLEAKDYDNFYKEVVNDAPFVRDRRALTDLEERYNGNIVYLTGRPERTREDTLNWLKKYYDFSDHPMLMRKDEDHRKSPELKAEMALKYVEDNDITACMVLDDMEDNVQAVVDTINNAHPSIRVLGATVTAPKKGDVVVEVTDNPSGSEQNTSTEATTSPEKPDQTHQQSSSDEPQPN